MLSHSRQLVFGMLVLHALLGIGVMQAASWRAEDITDWELAGDDLWRLNGDRLVQVSPGDTSAALLDYWAGPKGAQTDGDFTLTARAGFNPEGYPLGENGKINWRIYYRTIAVGVMADSANGIFAVFSRSNGERNGIVRLVDGNNIWLARPTGGQGVGLDIHDVREYKMSRQGRQITVWLDSVPVFQAEDTLGVLAGRPVVCGPGPVGILLKGMSLVHRAAEAPKVEMTAPVDSFIVGMDNGNGPLLRDIYGKPIGTVELGDSLFGWWTIQQGGKSWVAAGGQLSIPNFRMASEETIECWFRLLEVPPGDGVPILHFCFDGTRMDSTWLKRERGGPMARVFPDSSIGLHFHEFGDANADLPGIFKLGKWTHLAWVRQGALHRIYVDSKEVLSLHLPKYGDRPLTGLQLNVAQNADHDWIAEPGRPYMELSSMRAVPRALEPGQFIAQDFAKSLQVKGGVPFSLAINYPNPFSPSSTVPVNLPYGYEKTVKCDVLNKAGEIICEVALEDLQPGIQMIEMSKYLDKHKEIKTGEYFFRVRSGQETKVTWFVYLKPGETIDFREGPVVRSPERPQSAVAEEQPKTETTVYEGGCELSLETYMSSPGYDAMVEVAEGCEGKYRLAVMRGRNTAKVIFSGELKAGIHRFNWDGTGADGNQLLSGAHDMVLSGHGREIRCNIVVLR
jgi:hypothetical protein